MANLITGEVEKVSWSNRSFKFKEGEDWYKLGQSIEIDIKQIKKGQTVTIDYNPAEKDGRVTNWVNMIDAGDNGHAGESAPAKAQSKADPRDDVPPPGKYPTKDAYSRKDRLITLLALHKSLAPSMIQAGMDNPKDVWAAVIQHEAMLNATLDKDPVA